VINVKPGERLFFEVTADALGEWAFHCHMLYHMEAGMFRKVASTMPASPLMTASAIPVVRTRAMMLPLMLFHSFLA
jgi:Multicopper oxidase